MALPVLDTSGTTLSTFLLKELKVTYLGSNCTLSSASGGEPVLGAPSTERKGKERKGKVVGGGVVLRASS